MPNPAPLVHRLALACCLAVAHAPAEARTVYRCVRDGTVSLSTAPEPGSRCEAKTLEGDAAQAPNLWGAMGVFSGTLYEREQDGVLVYGTRKLPGARVYLRFTAVTPAGEIAHPGLGKVGAPRLDRYDRQFKAAARRHRVDDAWLRAIAHAESAFDPMAVSSKGAQGVMQLMPDVSAQYGVADPFSAEQSIDAGARHLRYLANQYGDDRRRIAAAYNAGVGAMTRYRGVPPFAETLEYVDKVMALYQRYREALGTAPLRPADSTPVEAKAVPVK
ncbi:MAG TPA: lytic transglycosylase domain-containing protein [Pseudoxanthomonas sp.]|nr:lytic transglycosylase domain-containing protein [Pseudoxanthomonas sp.]